MYAVSVQDRRNLQYCITPIQSSKGKADRTQDRDDGDKMTSLYICIVFFFENKMFYVHLWMRFWIALGEFFLYFDVNHREILVRTNKQREREMCGKSREDQTRRQTSCSL